jgi:hypothetical protein
MFTARACPILFVAPHNTNALQCCTSSPDSVLSVHWLPAERWRSVGLHRDDALGVALRECEHGQHICTWYGCKPAEN